MPDLDTPQLLALAASLGWASGMRLYAVVFLTGLAGQLGWVNLPTGLQVLQTPLLLWGSGGLMLVEFLADKIPWVDSAWDALHTLIRIPAGAALAYQVFGGGDAQGWALLAGLMGGGLAAGAHLAKATTRVAVNHSPEPFSNIGLSLLGDLTVPGLLWLGWTHPWALAGVLTVLAVLAGALIWTLWRFVRGLWSRGWSQRRQGAVA
ncbi:hypothetical protein HNQ51_000512 [Inhella inkyongensis]|uniref:DUF4126 domain-containing protein n=1 Tax=Inhella inkyongensis TaxID=392593 RepID=A0A840S3X3_9BURK|nr:DUF4126 domain-containing protein [Inhella inkyongensis]MBB5203219.1 hypothetical protein [Inhella inkyongensis]